MTEVHVHDTSCVLTDLHTLRHRSAHPGRGPLAVVQPGTATAFHVPGLLVLVIFGDNV